MNFLKNILLLALSLVVVYGIAEAVIVWKFGKTIMIQPRYVTGGEFGDFRIRRNIPNSSYRHKCYEDEWEFTINAQGFRDTRDFTYEKPEGTVRVLVIGDSFTIGYEVEQEETYSAVLERYLNKRGISAEVINAGMSGSGTAEELVLLENEGIKYNPDIVVIGFFRNDLHDNHRAGLFALENDSLITASREYLPAIGIRDKLNSFFLYRWLSENSYLHNYMNKVATLMVKKRVTNAAREQVAGKKKEGRPQKVQSYETRLACALLRKITEVAHDQGAWTVLLDICQLSREPSLPEASPETMALLADHYVNSAALFEEFDGLVDWTGDPADGGRGHWTAFGHAIAGIEIGKLIEAEITGRSQGNDPDLNGAN